MTKRLAGFPAQNIISVHLSVAPILFKHPYIGISQPIWTPQTDAHMKLTMTHNETLIHFLATFLDLKSPAFQARKTAGATIGGNQNCPSGNIIAS